MFQIVKELSKKVFQTKSAPITGYNSGGFKVLAANHKQTQSSDSNTYCSHNQCQRKFTSASNTTAGYNMKRLQGKVAVVTASTDG